MTDDRLHKILDDADAYDRAREDTLWGMVGDFYSKRMLSFAILIWGFGLAFTALAVFCGIAFFETDVLRYQIMYAAIFVSSVQMVALMKIFSWQMIHRNRIVRDLKRIEARLIARDAKTD
jgi:uncharacterized protein DUF6768